MSEEQQQIIGEDIDYDNIDDDEDYFDKEFAQSMPA